MAKYTTEELLEAFKETTLAELTEFRKAFEEEFDITAAAPVVIAAAGAVGGDATTEEKNEFDATLEDADARRIGITKTIREIVSGPGPKGTGKMVGSAPKTILEGASKDNTEAAKAKLEEAGAKVSLK